MELVLLTVFLNGLQWPYQLSLFLTVLLPTKMKMKVKKIENNRFNVETVVANYHFGTWNIGTLILLKVSQVRFVRFCAEGKLRFAVSRR